MATHTLLVADDSQTVRRIVEMACAGQDFDVVTAADGDGAIAEIAGRPPDIMLLDIVMPGQSGYDVAEFVKRRPDLAHIPVVLMAGMHDSPDEARAREIGCAEVLLKPLRPQVVVERLRHWLESRPFAPAALVADVPVAEDLATAPTPAAVEPSSPALDDIPLILDEPVNTTVGATELFFLEEALETTAVIPDVAPGGMAELVRGEAGPVAEAVAAVLADAVADLPLAPVETPPADVVASLPQEIGAEWVVEAAPPSDEPSPAPPGETEAVAETAVETPVVDAAEEYFNRLDQAFKTLGRPLQVGAGPVVPEVPADAAAASVPTLQELLMRLPEETRTRLTEETRSRLAADAAEASRQASGEAAVMDAIVSRVLDQLTRHDRMLDEIARRVAERIAADRH